MKLYIDTSHRDKIRIALDGVEYETQVQADRSQQVLPFIEESLQKLNKKLTDLTEIEVKTGAGSFTGLRIGVSVAQTLSWGLGIPVNGKLFSEQNFIEIKY